MRGKGREIVTSPASREGEVPFIAVGIGYARDVIIRAQDAEVMKFSRDHHLNTVRLCIYTKYFNNQPTAPIDLDLSQPEDAPLSIVDPLTPITPAPPRR